MIIEDIMTAEEYSRSRHKTPYIFELEKGSNKLYYFGTPHVRDPKSPLFAEIQNAFKNFSPDIVIVEGINILGNKEIFNNKIKVTSRNEVIERMGESGFLVKLAVEQGIDWMSPEPSDQDLYNHLLSKNFSKDEILAWNLFHILPQYNRQVTHIGFEKYAAPFIERFKEATNWGNFDYSYTHGIDIGVKLINKKIDVENTPDALDYVDPIPWPEKRDKQTVLNRISEDASLFRNKTIVSGIENALENHNKIFVLYGSSHAYMQEPALRKIF